jgi:hypothetical protein
MEDVIQTYQLPYDSRYPVVCFDEAGQQLFGEVRPWQRAKPGRDARRDHEYERKAVCRQLLFCEPLRGWRHVRVSERRTRKDYALALGDLLEVHYPKAVEARLVHDNLYTHDGASSYEVFSPELARSLLDRIEFHYTPKRRSRVNMAETETNVMKGQCLDRRSESQSKLASEVAAREKRRNEQKAKVHWTFTLAAARQKLRKCYPSNED